MPVSNGSGIADSIPGYVCDSSTMLDFALQSVSASTIFVARSDTYAFVSPHAVPDTCVVARHKLDTARAENIVLITVSILFLQGPSWSQCLTQSRTSGRLLQLLTSGSTHT